MLVPLRVIATSVARQESTHLCREWNGSTQDHGNSLLLIDNEAPLQPLMQHTTRAKIRPQLFHACTTLLFCHKTFFAKTCNELSVSYRMHTRTTIQGRDCKVFSDFCCTQLNDPIARKQKLLHEYIHIVRLASTVTKRIEPA